MKNIYINVEYSNRELMVKDVYVQIGLQGDKRKYVYQAWDSSPYTSQDECAIELIKNIIDGGAIKKLFNA